MVLCDNMFYLKHKLREMTEITPYFLLSGLTGLHLCLRMMSRSTLGYLNGGDWTQIYRVNETLAYIASHKLLSYVGRATDAVKEAELLSWTHRLPCQSKISAAG